MKNMWYEEGLEFLVACMQKCFVSHAMSTEYPMTFEFVSHRQILVSIQLSTYQAKHIFKFEVHAKICMKVVRPGALFAGKLRDKIRTYVRSIRHQAISTESISDNFICIPPFYLPPT